MVSYYLNLFSIETWSRFRDNGGRITGFAPSQLSRAQKIREGDVLFSYIKGLSRWSGYSVVLGEVFEDSDPIFSEENDKFTVRFDVRPEVMLDIDLALPVQDAEIWNALEMTRDIAPGSVGWGANFQGSLRSIPDSDAQYLMRILNKQSMERHRYELDDKDRRLLRSRPSVRTEQGELVVSIPDDTTSDADQSDPIAPRHSHVIQALIAVIGSKMGFKVWLPKNDRERCLSASPEDFSDALLNNLPMQYNDATVRTIEQIDALWIRGRSIARAFEVEHTTAIYSGLLRMADLVALQPDIQIPLHIVAPVERRENVLAQIARPVFSLLDTGPLADRCSYLSYDAIDAIAEAEHLEHMNHSIVSRYQEEVDLDI